MPWDGSVIYDLVNHNHDATITGTGLSFNPDLEGEQSWYAATQGTQASAFPADPAMNWQNSTPFTMTAWFRTTLSGIGNSAPFISPISSPSFTGWEFSVGYANPAFLGFYGNGVWYQDTIIINDGLAHHGVVTWDTTTLQFYVDGQPGFSTTGITIPQATNGTWSLGGRLAGNGSIGFPGSIWEIRAYNRAISGSEVACLAAPQTRWELYSKPFPFSISLPPAPQVGEIPSGVVGKYRQMGITPPWRMLTKDDMTGSLSAPVITEIVSAIVGSFRQTAITPPWRFFHKDSVFTFPTPAVFKDRVRETTLTTGTGTVALAGRSTAYQAFSNVLQNNGFVWYAIEDLANDLWEVGKGIFYSTPTQIQRFSGTPGTFQGGVYDGSSGPGNLVSFGPGVKSVYLTFPAAAATFEGFTG